MKTVFLILILCISYCSIAQNNTETLTNNDIIKLTKLGLPPTAIISKIKNSKTHFDVTVDGLVKLKEDGVNGDVVSEMINANSGEQKEAAGKKDMSDPKTMRTAGIYFYNSKDSARLFIPIDPTVVSNSKSGGFGTALAQHYTYGIAKNKMKSSLSG